MGVVEHIYGHGEKSQNYITLQTETDRAVSRKHLIQFIMKVFDIYPLGPDYPITVKGNYAEYLRNLNSGKYKTHRFEVVEIDAGLKKRIIRVSNDRSSNRGHWYAHCNGYNMDLILHYDGKIEINTYHNYRTVRNDFSKNQFCHY